MQEYAFKTKPVAIERQERGFRVERWHMNANPPPFHRKVVRNNEPVDRRNIGQMHVPGIFLLETLFSPAGSGAKISSSIASVTPASVDGCHFGALSLSTIKARTPSMKS